MGLDEIYGVCDAGNVAGVVVRMPCAYTGARPVSHQKAQKREPVIRRTATPKVAEITPTELPVPNLSPSRCYFPFRRPEY